MVKDREDNLKELKAEYEKLRAKYKLPSFDELDEEFEIRRIESDLWVMREVRRAMSHRITSMADLFEPVLNPSGGSLHSIIETKVFEKEQIDDMYSFYKHLWMLVHKGISASLESEKAEADWVKDVWKGWKKIKEKTLKYSDKLAEGWAQEEKEGLAEKYMG